MRYKKCVKLLEVLMYFFEVLEYFLLSLVLLLEPLGHGGRQSVVRLLVQTAESIDATAELCVICAS